jgi:hypothetical protein
MYHTTTQKNATKRPTKTKTRTIFICFLRTGSHVYITVSPMCGAALTFDEKVLKHCFAPSHKCTALLYYVTHWPTRWYTRIIMQWLSF